MIIKDFTPIVGKIIEWIGEWKSKSTERLLRKRQKLKDQLADVEKELLKYNNFKNPADYRQYVRLLRDKRVLKRKLEDLAC